MDLRCGHLINSKVINKLCSAFRVSGNNKTSQHIKNNIVVRDMLRSEKVLFASYSSDLKGFDLENGLSIKRTRFIFNLLQAC